MNILYQSKKFDDLETHKLVSFHSLRFGSKQLKTLTPELYNHPEFREDFFNFSEHNHRGTYYHKGDTSVAVFKTLLDMNDQLVKKLKKSVGTGDELRMEYIYELAGMLGVTVRYCRYTIKDNDYHVIFFGKDYSVHPY